MEVVGSGARTRLVTCVQPSHLLYFVLRGKITSRRQSGTGTQSGTGSWSRRHREMAAEADAIGGKWRYTNFAGLDDWTGPLDWTTGLTQNGVACLSSLFQCRSKANHAHFRLLLC